MNLSRPPWRKWLVAAVKLLIAAAVLWWIHRAIAGALEQFRQHPWSLHWGWLTLSAFLYLAGLLPEGLFWRRALRAMGQDAPLGRTLRAYYIGHLGKYVPGKAMVVVLRTGLICGPGVNAGVAAASVFLETLTMMAVGACLGAAVLVFHSAHGGPLLWASLGLMLVAGVPTLPPVFSRLARLAGVGRSDPSVAVRLGQVPYRTLLWGWAMMILGWGLMGASLWATLKAMGVGGGDLLPSLVRDTAVVALAVVAGFVSFIPGGAIVREGAIAKLLVLLAPQVGEPPALVAAVVFRLVSVMAELAISAILYLGWRETGDVVDCHPRSE
jgi:hypothetical protein